VNRYSHQIAKKALMIVHACLWASFRAHRPDFLCTYVACEVVLMVRLSYGAQLSGSPPL
jgi:hypothetical protein